MEVINCVLLGDKGVGKSSLLLGYKNLLATDLEAPKKVLDPYRFTVPVDSASYELRVFNPSGQEEVFDRLMPFNYPGTDVFVICFAIDDVDSFYNVENKFVPQVQQVGPNIPIVLVGTKEDLRGEDVLDRSRFLTTMDGVELGHEINAAIYVECSALSQTNLSNVFVEAVRAACTINHQKKGPKRSCSIL